MKTAAKTRHLYREVGGVRVHYREAGVPGSTAVVLVHGFPSSSYSFRGVLPLIGEHAYVIAPDLPGSGFTEAPADFEYTFERQSQVLEALLAELGVEKYVLYVTDYGTPTGYLMAMRDPGRVRGLVVQNGNTHEAGLTVEWEAVKRYWAEPTAENKAALADWMNFEGTRDQYIGGLPAELQDRHPTESWHLDWDRLSRPGMIDAQWQLFVDYQHHVARFDEIVAYHKQWQPPCLVVWGRHDPYFDIAEVLAYQQDLDTVDIHIYDGGHHLLETHSAEVAEHIITFVGNL
ncbi:alpha/beta fold hydrolase [Kribbella sp. NPDC056345]|uniref:alpha/beta fold hydrolase n=1 Tax=Kribbella sp. NPDC056345 TaxID=3345789 RepID=UPI0035E33F66